MGRYGEKHHLSRERMYKIELGKHILAATGVTGKSGLVFLQKLIENQAVIKEQFSDGVRLLVRDSRKLPKNLISDMSSIEGVLTDDVYLSDALKNVDTLVHIAGVHWTDHIVKSAVDNHVRRLILVHTTGIYSRYKMAGEEYRQIDERTYQACRVNGIKLTILRPTMIYGSINDQNVAVFIKMVDKFPLMPVVNGARYKLQPVHYADLGQAYYDVLLDEETVGHDYVLSGGQKLDLREMLVEIGNNLGKHVSFISCPFFIAYTGAWLIYMFTFGKMDYRERVQRLCEPRVYSHEKATQAFNYEPRSFKQGIVDEVQEYLQNRGAK